MPKDPYHERPWAELLFYLAVSAILGGLALLDFIDTGAWLSLAFAAFGLVGVLIMGVVIRRKRASRSSPPARNANG